MPRADRRVPDNLAGRVAPANGGIPIFIGLALLVLSIIAPAMLMIGGLVWQVGRFDRERADLQALQLARSVSADIDRDIEASIDTLRALASSPALQRGNLDRFYAQATESLRSRNLYVLLRTPDGQQILNTRVAFGMELPRHPLRASEASVLSTREPSVTSLVEGAVARTWVLGLSVPVIINDKPVYVLTMSINPEHIQRMLVQTPRDDGWVLAVSDANGRLIARSEDHVSYLGRVIHPQVKDWSLPPEGTHRTDALAGHEVLRGYRWSTRTNWITAAFVPTSVIDAPRRRLWRLSSVFGVALVGLALPLIILLGRDIARPIADAAIDARRLGRGETVTASVSRLREANELSLALADASAQLRERARALAENEALFRSVFEQSAVGFEQVALDGRMIGINDRLCRMLGYTREECLEKTFKTLTHPDDWKAEEALIAAIEKNEQPHYEIEKRLITKSGETIWVRVTSSFVRGPDGKAMHRVSVVEDITERRQIHDAAARLAAIVQSSRDAMISATLTGRIETWNPGAEDLFGYRAEEIVGRSLDVLVPANRKGELVAKLAGAANGETVKLETVRQHKDGTPIDVTSTAAPIWRDGIIRALSVTMEDIRERKAREEQVLLLNRELAHRVKNTLAVIQSIANQTLRSTPRPEAFRIAFQGRLQALAAANEQLLQTSWSGSELSDFIDRQLAPLMPRVSRKLVKTGPRMKLPVDLLMPLGLALHELGTNAVKYGAWSSEAGRVEVTWSVDATGAGAHAERLLVIVWREVDGPSVSAPPHQGFGTTVIERGIPNARVTRTYEPSGIVCRLEIPIDA